MLDHITLRVADLNKSKEFYEKVLPAVEGRLAFGEDGVFHAFEFADGTLYEIAQLATPGPITPTHVAFRVEDKTKVDEFYELAMAAGAKNNGKPGTRPNYSENYYACFVLDPDGHNIEAMYDA